MALGAQLLAVILPHHDSDRDNQNDSERTAKVEDAPAPKVQRSARTISITDVKMHNRLHIYDFVGFDFNLDAYLELNQFGGDYIKEDDNNLKMYARIGHAAAIFGDLEALEYLTEIDDNPLSPNRVRVEHRYILKWMYYLLGRCQHWKGLKIVVQKKYFADETGNLVGGAIRGGANMEILKWLLSMGCIADHWTFIYAAEYGNIEIMKWLREIDCPWDEDTFYYAMEHNDLDMVRWLKKEGCPWDAGVFENAAKTGNRDLMLWLRVQGCPWNARTFSSAIDGGVDMLTLEWLHHEKCPWNEYAMIAAVKRGDLEILRWLREKQCPWNAECFHAALKKKNGDVLEWLRQEKCPLTETTIDLLFQNLKSCYESK
jgi:hypothetical protein